MNFVGIVHILCNFLSMFEKYASNVAEMIIKYDCKLLTVVMRIEGINITTKITNIA